MRRDPFPETQRYVRALLNSVGGGGFDPIAEQMLAEHNALAGVQSPPYGLVTPAPPAAAPAQVSPSAPGAASSPAALPPVGMGAPVAGLVSPLSVPMGAGSEYGVPDPEGAPDRKGRRYHAAKDWFAPAGSPVSSPVTGRIVEVRASRGNSGQVFGGTVKVQDSRGRVFVFRHVNPGSVQVGQKVRAGAPIATVSPWTGGSAHAHVEVWRTLEGGYRYENMLDPARVFGKRK